MPAVKAESIGQTPMVDLPVTPPPLSPLVKEAGELKKGAGHRAHCSKCGGMQFGISQAKGEIIDGRFVENPLLREYECTYCHKKYEPQELGII